MKQSTSKFTILCSCSQATCPQCGGRGVIAIGNITFKEMQEGILYSVKGPYYDSYSFDDVQLKRDADTLTVAFVENEEAADKLTVVFKLPLLDALRENGEKLKPMCVESESLIGYLMENPNMDEYDLDTLVEIIGLGVEQAESCACLRQFDAKWGTSFSKMVSRTPDSPFPIDREYVDLCKFAAELIEEEGVTFHWALRRYEETGGCTVLEVLSGAGKTFDQLERDVSRLRQKETTCKLGPDFREIDLVEAMKLFKEGIPVYVDWERVHRVTKGTWCELNVNHLQHGQWFVEL
ncbi:hypothetical protein ACLBWT_18430 [Paenibacillus sp. D51F]